MYFSRLFLWSDREMGSLSMSFLDFVDDIGLS